jgi:HIP---CoA ligase
MDQAPWTTLPQLIEDAGRRFAHVEALVEDDTRWTFADLNERVHSAARALIASNIAEGDRVALWAPNLSEWVVAALATYSVGAVLVPVNTRFKGAEAAFVLRKSGVRLLFTATGFLDNDYVGMVRAEPDLDMVEEIVVLRGDAPAGTVSMREFLDRGHVVDESTRAARLAAVSTDDECHILFTSGTTGEPKGVSLRHGQICNAYWTFCGETGLQQGDRYLIVLPFFHSFGLHSGILACLMVGATIVPELVFDARDVVRRIRTERITAFPGPPTIFQSILADPDLDPADLESLRLTVVSASAIPVELIEQIHDRLGVECVITGYGLTEASGIVAMCNRFDPPEVVANTAGRPLPGVELRIVDDDGRVLPHGAEGEILVRGPNIMSGYVNEPARTAETIDADGWLHTGDVGKFRSDGNLVITDRKKEMFIVGGFNVAPAEVERAMAMHDSIAQVAVIGVPDERLGEIGFAFVVPRAGARLDEAALVSWCRERMANFKVPRHVEVVDAFPLNATGKVLKYRLRERAAELLGVT